ncbi:MAG: hypothetical protein HYY32_04630 [Chloroflexi bacterium]|nr:hypothetical protein [Chloroflexota bacterium]
MTINTSSETLSLARELDESAASAYEAMVAKFGAQCSVLAGFAAENRKLRDQIERAYYGVITDAIEGCFCFNLEPDAYRVGADVSRMSTENDAIRAALQIEEAAAKFYKDAGQQGSLTMADFGRALALVARKREDRARKLRSSLQPF